MVLTSTRMAVTFQTCYLVIFIISVQISLEVTQASRSLAKTSESMSASSRLRYVTEYDRNYFIRPSAKHAKILREMNWEQFSQKLLTRQMGSKPPDCQDKCDPCLPCQAVEVPISNRAVKSQGFSSQQDLQMAPAAAEPDDATNYMPESWRCACGDEYYNP